MKNFMEININCDLGEKSNIILQSMIQIYLRLLTQQILLVVFMLVMNKQ